MQAKAPPAILSFSRLQLGKSEDVSCASFYEVDPNLLETAHASGSFFTRNSRVRRLEAKVHVLIHYYSILGFILGMLEKKMETTIVYWGFYWG